MAIVNIPSKGKTLTDPQEFTSYLAGIDIDYEVIGDSGSMLMVSVSGTAVTIS